MKKAHSIKPYADDESNYVDAPKQEVKEIANDILTMLKKKYQHVEFVRGESGVIEVYTPHRIKDFKVVSIRVY